MKTFSKSILLSGLLALMAYNYSASGATTVINDDCTVTTSGTGFALNAGVNTGVNPPTTRLTGSAAANLRYFQTFTARLGSFYDISSNRIRVTADNSVGRFVLSANGSTSFDFGPALGSSDATPSNPSSYDVKISMRNDATGNSRLSFGIATVEGDVNNLDFGVQIFRSATADTFYTIQKRIDRGSFNGTTTTDATGDVNATMKVAQASTAATMMDFLIRVTDAGSESGANYNSRIQVSTNSGSTWIYDTATDSAVSNHFRFDGTGRHMVFDQAPNTTGSVFYDAFSVTWNSGPRTWSGAGANGNWSNLTNWGGTVPVNGSALNFTGTTRQTNTNDLSGLSVPWLNLNTGGFALFGNALTVSGAVTNVTGSSTVNNAITAGGTLRFQSDAGTLTLAGAVTGGAQNLIVDGVGNTTASGAISGTGGLTKGGSGTLTLSGTTANTLSGNSIVNTGVISLAKTAGVNALAGNMTIGDGAGGAGVDILRLAAANQISDTAAITVSASGSFDLNGFAETVGSVSGASSASQIALGAGTLTAGDANPATFAGVISGSGNVVKQGSGTLTLSGANSFSGTATINAGVVNVQNATALGSTGATVVSGGALEVQGGITVSGEPLTLNGTGVSSGGALRNISGNNSWSGAVTLGSAARVNSDSGALTISGGIGGGQALTVGGAGNTTASGVISGTGGLTKDGTGVLQLSGASANTYSGSTVVNAGTLSLAKTAGLNAVAGNLTIGDGSGTDVVQLAAANQIVDSSAVTISAGGSLDLNGFNETVASVSGASSTSQIALGAGTLTVGDANTATFAGSISGTGNLVKQGSGKLTLTGASTFSGTATISVGAVNIQNATALGSTGATTVSSGTALEIQGGIAVSGEALTLNGTGISSGGALRNISGNNSWSGAVTLGSATTIQSDSGTLTLSGGVAGSGQSLTAGGIGNTTISGVISGSGTLTKAGSGTLTLSGANTYSGNTTISAGTLALGSGGSIASSPVITITTGTTFDVSAISYSVGSGQTLARNATSGTGNINGSATLNSGATVSLQADGIGGTVGSLSVVGGLILNSNTFTINVTGSALGVGTYTLISYTGSKSGSFNTNATITGSGIAVGMLAQIVEASGQINLQVSNPPRIWSGGASNDNWSAGANWAGLAPANGDRLTFNGTTRQTNTNDISGLSVLWVTFNNGGFALNGNALTVTSAITNSIGNNSLNGSLTLGGAVRMQSDSGTLSVSGGISGGSQNLAVGGSGNTTVNSVISGTGSLTKDGSGLLQLSGASANTYSGSTIVNAGTLSLAKTSGNAISGNVTVSDGTGSDIVQLSAANQISDSSAVTISSSGVLDLNGFSETVASISSGSSASQISLGSATLTVGDASSSTFAGTVSGSGGVVKQGAGTLTLSGANSYSGNTTISAGTLALGTGGSISSSPTITIANGTTFDVSAISYSVGASQTLARNSTSGSGSVNGSITLSSGAGVSLQANGTGATVGSLSVTGNLTLNGNTIAINVTGSALGASTNALVSYTGSKSGSFNATPTITGLGLAPGMVAQIAESAGQISLRVYYDPTRTWSGNGANGNWSNGANWAGLAPANGDLLIFSGTTRQTNTNDLTGLTVPWLTFNNGGFALYGNELIVSSAITNLTGNNTLKENLAWSSTAAKNWSIASGSELLLDNTTTVGVTGDHSVVGGGTLRLIGTMNFTNTPVFAVNEGKHILDGGTFSSLGGYRIGSLATGAGAQTILTNGASLTITATGGGLRVGDSANPNTSRLDIDNSTLTLTGGVLLAVPYAAGSTGVVNQIGGTVSGCIVSFNDVGAGSGSYTIKNGTLVAKQIRENTPAGSASIYFDNAILRTETGANSAFLTGLDLAQIQAGGLTVDATTLDITIGQALTGTGALTKTGSNKVSLSGANTYSGNTTITAGTLALGVGGAIASSPNITIANGTTLDVSAISFSLGATQTLLRNSTSGSGSVNGSMTLASGAKISLQANGSGTVGTLSVAGGLTLNANVITVNIAGGSIGLGTYPLVTYTGTKSGSFNTNATITGSGIASGTAARIVETTGQISLEVYTPGIPAHGIAAATIKVVENDLANTTNSVTVTTTMSINGLQVRDGSSRGDYTVQVGASGTDDVNAGVLISSVAENGKDHGEDSGINYCTTSISLNSGGYFIPTCQAPDGTEYNINVSTAYFPYNKYLGGYARNSAGTAGGANNLLTASAGINLGTQFVDNGGGLSTVNLTNLGINSQTDGVLLVTAGANNNEYASSKPNADGTWTVYVKDNGTNGTVTTQGPVAFAFVPKSNTSVISGKFQGDGTILMYNGVTPRFSVVNTTNGTWKLTIPGYSSFKGVLVISAEGGGAFSADNILSAQPSGSDWIIQSRDLPGLGLQTPPEAVASFIFIPAPSITLVAPANNANVSSSPTLTVSATTAVPGNLTVTFNGHRLPKAGPGEDFLIPVLPDTQNYARENAGSGDAVKEMWFAQTDWILSHRASDNIPFVATLGDCVQNGNDSSEWKNATNAYYRLEKQSLTDLLEGIPYGVTVGNHDQAPNGDPDGSTSSYNQYFGISHFSGKSYYGGHYDVNNDNWFDTFSVSGLDFLVISFEYGRYGSLVMDWADSVIAARPNHRVIVLTHHAGDDNADVNATTTTFSAQGSAIYEALKHNQNFFLMLGGHVFNEGGEGRRADTFSGHTTRTLVSDYQGRFNGGNGLMRLMYFSPSNNLVSVKTYSPWTGSFETDANSQFSFSYNMQPNGAGVAGTSYAALKTTTNVVQGAQTSFLWSGLTASRTYEWYVTVTDANGDYATSAEWKFNTTSGFARPENPSDSFAAWSATYGVTDPNADTDGDGQNNFAEFVAKTNPTDATSTLRVLNVKCSGDGQATLTWSSVGGVRYRIQYAGVIGGEFTDIVRDEAVERDSNPSDTTTMQSFTAPLAPTNSALYYRIKVVP